MLHCPLLFKQECACRLAAASLAASMWTVCLRLAATGDDVCFVCTVNYEYCSNAAHKKTWAIVRQLIVQCGTLILYELILLSRCRPSTGKGLLLQGASALISNKLAPFWYLQTICGSNSAKISPQTDNVHDAGDAAQHRGVQSCKAAVHHVHHGSQASQTQYC